MLGFLYSPHLNTTTGKTIALTIRTFVGKVMSWLFNMLCRLVITFLDLCQQSDVSDFNMLPRFVNAGDLGSIPGLGRSCGEGNGNPPQYSRLENSMDRGA